MTDLINPAPDWQGAVVRFIEKVGSTYVQAVILALIASGWFDRGTFDIDLLGALAIAAIPTAITVIANRISGAAIPADWPYVVHLFVRVVQTFVAGFAGYLAAVPFFTLDPSIGRAALSGAGLAVLAFLKGEAARFVGQKGTAALVPARFDVRPGQFAVAA